MVNYNKINSFVEDVAEKVHNLGADALTIALTTTVNAPTSASTVLAGITQIANYANTGTRVPTITSSAQTSGTYKLVLADLTLTATGTVGPFGTVVLYNDTPTSPADPLIAWWLYGSDITMANAETFRIDFDDTNGVLTIG